MRSTLLRLGIQRRAPSSASHSPTLPLTLSMGISRLLPLLIQGYDLPMYGSSQASVDTTTAQSVAAPEGSVDAPSRSGGSGALAPLDTLVANAQQKATAAAAAAASNNKKDATANANNNGRWVCPTCDHNNANRNTKCAACSSYRDTSARGSYLCSNASCGHVNPRRAATCEACGEPFAGAEDWVCPDCRTENMRLSTSCRQCRAPQPPTWSCSCCADPKHNKGDNSRPLRNDAQKNAPAINKHNTSAIGNDDVEDLENSQHTENSIFSRHCQRCGAQAAHCPPTSPLRPCVHCGAKMLPTFVRCHVCAATQVTRPANKKPPYTPQTAGVAVPKSSSGSESLTPASVSGQSTVVTLGSNDGLLVEESRNHILGSAGSSAPPKAPGPAVVPTTAAAAAAVVPTTTSTTESAPAGSAGFSAAHRWACAHCGHATHASLTNCAHCGTQRIPLIHKSLVAPMWICKACGTESFIREAHCKKCGADRVPMAPCPFCMSPSQHTGHPCSSCQRTVYCTTQCERCGRLTTVTPDMRCLHCSADFPRSQASGEGSDDSSPTTTTTARCSRCSSPREHTVCGVCGKFNVGMWYCSPCRVLVKDTLTHCQGCNAARPDDAATLPATWQCGQCGENYQLNRKTCGVRGCTGTRSFPKVQLRCSGCHQMTPWTTDCCQVCELPLLAVNRELHPQSAGAIAAVQQTARDDELLASLAAPAALAGGRVDLYRTSPSVCVEGACEGASRTKIATLVVNTPITANTSPINDQKTTMATAGEKPKTAKKPKAAKKRSKTASKETKPLTGVGKEASTSSSSSSSPSLATSSPGAAIVCGLCGAVQAVGIAAGSDCSRCGMPL